MKKVTKEDLEELRDILCQMCFCKSELNVIVKGSDAIVTHPSKDCSNEEIRRLAFIKITELKQSGREKKSKQKNKYRRD
jgi:hypothetical protein